MKKILITGAAGQIGSELTELLRNKYGNENVIATIHNQSNKESPIAKPFGRLDSRDQGSLKEIVNNEKIDTVNHLVSLLSAKAEENPQLAWDVNANGLVNVLEVARMYNCGY